jgi:hypothetical protein
VQDASTRAEIARSYKTAVGVERPLDSKEQQLAVGSGLGGIMQSRF